MLRALAAFNVAMWALAIGAFHERPELLGMALLAYTFGLRHALDADHISAIDNVVRKLMHERRDPVDAGLFFSLGHSTVVVALTVAIAVAAGAVQGHLHALSALGAAFGSSFSIAFLLTIASVNVVVLIDIVRAMRNGGAERDSAPRGPMARLLAPVLKIVKDSRRMYPVGLLFGLGFDTATEVGLLGIAAVGAGKGLPIYEILIFPLLFTAGMTLLDTADGVLMCAAYGWALLEPQRKLSYNFAVTAVSVVAALFVVLIEAAGLGKGGAFFNDNLHWVGIAIVGLFAAIVLTQISVVEGGRAFLQSRGSGRGWLHRRDPDGLLE